VLGEHMFVRSYCHLSPMAPSRNAVTRAGRPPGSTDGMVPAGGFPAVDLALGAFLAGFIEGEA